jgi:putative aminopeptidase FrvX
MDSTELLLKELTEASGVSGFESEVRAVMRRYFTPLGEISHDKTGSIICCKTGTASEPRVALAGHMDEVGFIVKYITREGFIRFTPLGGWWDQVLLAHRVTIRTGKGDVTGVIGAKPPHLLSEAERKKVVEKKDMYIDIGATSQLEVEQAGVAIGDPVIPESAFTPLSVPKTYMAKALDNRLGCALTIRTLQNLEGKNHPNTLFGVATVQEEVGLRGATTSVEVVNPDLAIITEVDVAGDVPGIKPEESHIKLGAGPSLLVYDARMLPNQRLRDLVISIARENNIPLQLSAMEGGATDGGPIHLHRAGVPTVVISVPTRGIHGHNAIFNLKDFEWTVALLVALVLKLDEKTVSRLTDWR